MVGAGLKFAHGTLVERPILAVGSQQFPYIRSLNPNARESGVERRIAGLPPAMEIDLWSNRRHHQPQTPQHAKKHGVHHRADMRHAAIGCHRDDGLHQAKRGVGNAPPGIVIRGFKTSDHRPVSGTPPHHLGNRKTGDFRRARPRQQAIVVHHRFVAANMSHWQPRSLLIVAGQQQSDSTDYFSAFAVPQHAVHGGKVMFVGFQAARVPQGILERVFNTVDLIPQTKAFPDLLRAFGVNDLEIPIVQVDEAALF